MCVYIPTVRRNGAAESRSTSDEARLVKIHPSLTNHGVYSVKVNTQDCGS